MLHFYRERDMFGEFSNFFPATIEINGKKYKTSEHFYQSMKTTVCDIQEQIRLSKSPKLAADLGRKIQLRPDWDDVKESFMRTALLAKFTQNPSLRQLLLETENLKLIENSEFDSYWGCGKDGTGKNRLGFLLMELRDKLSATDTKKN